MGEEQNVAFVKLIDLIANILSVLLEDSSKQSRLKCDASHSGLGAYLEEAVEPKVWAPVF